MRCVWYLDLFALTPLRLETCTKRSRTLNLRRVWQREGEKIVLLNDDVDVLCWLCAVFPCRLRLSVVALLLLVTRKARSFFKMNMIWSGNTCSLTFNRRPMMVARTWITRPEMFELEKASGNFNKWLVKVNIDKLQLWAGRLRSHSLHDAT